MKTVGSCRNSIRLAVSWRGDELKARAASRARGGREPNPLRKRHPPHDRASGQWKERRGALEHAVERAVVRKVELIRRRRVDQRNPGDLRRVVLRVDERVGAADGVSGKDIRPRDMRYLQELVQVGRQLVTVLANRPTAAPAFSGAIECADTRCRETRSPAPTPSSASIRQDR